MDQPNLSEASNVNSIDIDEFQEYRKIDVNEIKTKPSSPKGTRRLSVLHGKKLPVTIGSAEPDA